MTVTVYGLDGNPFDQNSIEAVGARFLREYVKLVLTGNYPTGGDTLDLTNGGGAPANPTVIPTAEVRGLAFANIRAISKLTTSFAAAGGQYSIISAPGVIPVPFASLSTLKLQLWLGTGAQYANGAYGADALGDEIIAELVFAR